MSLRDRINQEMKEAMRAGDKRRLGAVRLLLAAIKQVEVDERISPLPDDRVLAVIQKMVKQRRESLEQYRSAGRDDLAEQEAFEIGVLEAYLPKALDDAEVDALIDEAIAASGATSMKEMGKVMGVLKPKLQGRADMGKVSARVKAKLAG
ncbi:MAG TPA: GatB/YqeY domain-containing protein [Thiotrichales bacterium]|nr:GatB/YqeY domain-containing protein [Thiotrichales bacterium]